MCTESNKKIKLKILFSTSVINSRPILDQIKLTRKVLFKSIRYVLSFIKSLQLKKCLIVGSTSTIRGRRKGARWV